MCIRDSDLQVEATGLTREAARNGYTEWAHHDFIPFLQDSQEIDTTVVIVVHNCTANGAAHHRSKNAHKIGEQANKVRKLTEQGKEIDHVTLQGGGRKSLSFSAPGYVGHCEALRVTSDARFKEVIQTYYSMNDLHTGSIKLLDYDIQHCRADMNCCVAAAFRDDSALRRQGYFEKRDCFSRPLYLQITPAGRELGERNMAVTVSYTHLTLPTSDLV